MFSTNPYATGPKENPFQSIDVSTGAETPIEPRTRMHGEFLSLIEHCSLHIDPFVIKGLGIVMSSERIDAPILSVDDHRDTPTYDDKWLRTFVWEYEDNTYTCTIDFYACTIRIEREPTATKTEAIYRGTISRFVPYNISHDGDETCVDVMVIIKSMSTVVSPFEKHNELYTIAQRMFDDALLTSNKQASTKERADAADRLATDLRTCANDPELGELTAVYRDTKPKTEVNVGYDQVAVSKFIAKLAHRYNRRLESPLVSDVDNLTYLRHDQTYKDKHPMFVDLATVEDYGLNINDHVDHYDLTYVSQCTGIAKSTLSSLRTGNKAIDSLTIPTASLLTQMGEIYYFKQLKNKALNSSSPFDSDADHESADEAFHGDVSVYWSFDLHTVYGTHTVDYTDKHAAERDQSTMVSVITDDEPNLCRLGENDPACRQFTGYLSGSGNTSSNNATGCPLYGVSGVYVTTKGDD